MGSNQLLQLIYRFMPTRCQYRSFIQSNFVSVSICISNVDHWFAPILFKYGYRLQIVYAFFIIHIHNYIINAKVTIFYILIKFGKG